MRQPYRKHYRRYTRFPPDIIRQPPLFRHFPSTTVQRHVSDFSEGESLSGGYSEKSLFHRSHFIPRPGPGPGRLMDGLRFAIPPASRGSPWFEDGNIILLVEDDNHDPLKAFKVHRGVLARQSEVFETMFDIPRPTPGMDPIEQVDGCPVVRMYDLPNELSDLITALYDGVCVMQFNFFGSVA